MYTRTSREKLNNLAVDAGKLCITCKKDILGFVDAANQIDVAPGEDLGEGAIKNIGKIVNVFEKSTKDLESMDLKGKMLAVGSAINELGSGSTASEEYMVAFAGRIGGIATQAGITVDQVLGYASGLDQNMQALEVSATSRQKRNRVKAAQVLVFPAGDRLSRLAADFESDAERGLYFGAWQSETPGLLPQDAFEAEAYDTPELPSAYPIC